MRLLYYHICSLPLLTFNPTFIAFPFLLSLPCVLLCACLFVVYQSVSQNYFCECEDDRGGWVESWELRAYIFICIAFQKSFKDPKKWCNCYALAYWLCLFLFSPLPTAAFPLSPKFLWWFRIHVFFLLVERKGWMKLLKTGRTDGKGSWLLASQGKVYNKRKCIT